MNRRNFIVHILIFLNLGWLIGCSSDSSSPAGGTSAGGDGNCGNDADVVYTNPGHAHTESDLTSAEITTAAPGNYTLLIGAHSHTFSLTAQDFTDLQAGQTLTKSDLEGHGHSITIRC